MEKYSDPKMEEHRRLNEIINKWKQQAYGDQEQLAIIDKAYINLKQEIENKHNDAMRRATEESIARQREKYKGNPEKLAALDFLEGVLNQALKKQEIGLTEDKSIIENSTGADGRDITAEYEALEAWTAKQLAEAKGNPVRLEALDFAYLKAKRLLDEKYFPEPKFLLEESLNELSLPNTNKTVEQSIASNNLVNKQHNRTISYGLALIVVTYWLTAKDMNPDLTRFVLQLADLPDWGVFIAMLLGSFVWAALVTRVAGFILVKRVSYWTACWGSFFVGNIIAILSVNLMGMDKADLRIILYLIGYILWLKIDLWREPKDQPIEVTQNNSLTDKKFIFLKQELAKSKPALAVFVVFILFVGVFIFNNLSTSYYPVKQQAAPIIVNPLNQHIHTHSIQPLPIGGEKNFKETFVTPQPFEQTSQSIDDFIKEGDRLLGTHYYSDISSKELAEGRRYFESGQYKRALPLLQNALKDHPNDEELVLMVAASLLNTNKLDQAIEMFLHGMDLNPSNSEPEIGLAWAYAYKKDFNTAIIVLSGVIKRDPNNSSAHYCLGMSLIADGDYSTAYDEYKKLKQLKSPRAKDVIRLLNKFSTKHWKE